MYQNSSQNNSSTQYIHELEKVDDMNLNAWKLHRSYPADSLKIAEETHQLSSKANYTLGIACSLKVSGAAYYLMSDFESAIVDTSKALELFRNIGDQKSESDCLRILGNVCHALKDYKKSISYYEKALSIVTEFGDKKRIAYNLGNIGHVHFLCKQHKEAHSFFIQTKNMLEEIGDHLGLAEVLNNIGTNYFEQGELQKAFENYSAALELSNEVANLRGIAKALQSLGAYYKQEEKLDVALNYFHQALEVAEKFEGKKMISDIAQHLSQLYERADDYKKALHYFKLHDRLKTEIQNNSNKDTITAIQVQFDLEQLEKEKESIQQKNIELARFHKELEEKNIELELLSLVASQSDNIIIIADAQGELHFVNDSFSRFYETTLAEIKSTKGTTIFETSSNPNIRAIVEEAISNKKSVTYEVMNHCSSGKKVWSSALLTPVFNTLGELTNFVVIETDITERKKAAEIIVQKNKDITASITYGKRIQEAILPDKTRIKSEFLDSFIHYQPKDIVSGDFYWFDTKNEDVVFAVADCTGHGVPGAFMSMIGNDILFQVVNDPAILTPADALLSLDSRIKKALNQTGEGGETTDGMDIALCHFNRSIKNNEPYFELNFAGAYRPLWLIRNDELIEFRADRLSIGGDAKLSKNFTHHQINSQPGDVYYMFTDGCIDLFGGENGKKFRTNGLKKMLLSIHQLPMDQQEQIISTTFKNWKGDLEQVDDILIMGFRIK